MTTDHIRYDILAREALRGVLKRVLTDAAENGLPGEHHFFITFYTKAPGVKLSPRLLSQYPDEMTIILQHQFWDLRVTAEQFEVGLSFNGIPERLVIPFDSIKGFFDPSVQFGLQFETAEEKSAANTASPPVVKTEPKPAPAKDADKDPSKNVSKDSSKDAAPAAEAAADPDADKPDDPKPTHGGAEVVRLDKFRKK
jgi:hypothetical protein